MGYKTFNITTKEFSVLRFLDKQIDFIDLSILKNYMKRRLYRSANKERFKDYFYRIFKALMKKKVIIISNGVIFYEEKETQITLKKVIDNNTIATLDFNLKLLIDRNWRIKLNPEIKPIIPFLIKYFNLVDDDV